jgi:hypothetical protein
MSLWSARGNAYPATAVSVDAMSYSKRLSLGQCCRVRRGDVNTSSLSVVLAFAKGLRMYLELVIFPVFGRLCDMRDFLRACTLE